VLGLCCIAGVAEHSADSGGAICRKDWLSGIRIARVATRCAFILGMAGVAMLPDKINALTRIALLLFLLFAFNVSRGISFCGFLPWITQWIPEEVRGATFTRSNVRFIRDAGHHVSGDAVFEAAESKYSYGLLFFVGF